MPVLTLLIVVPLLGLVAILLTPKAQAGAHRKITLVATFIPILIVVYMLFNFNYHQPGMQFVEQHSWIPSIGVSYFVGVDGISLALLVLSALLGFLAALASASIKTREKEYYAWYMLLQAAIFGVFVSLDLILFYVFFELVLVPMYFLIGIWGGPRREYAALKFFIYTLLGSVIMLVGILAMYLSDPARTFNILELMKFPFDPRLQVWAFAALWAGFAVKVPVFPLHTWLPDAHVEAPTPISVLLAGILLKMGTYGFVRIAYPLLPQGAKYWAYAVAVLGLINIVYGALVAMAQKDLKKMVAYSSINHMGFVMLGLAAGTPLAVAGAIYQMIAHGLSSGMMFLMVGQIYDRTHTREIARLRGLFTSVPVIGVTLAFASLASMGLPGLAGFIAELFVLLGSYPVYPGFVILAVLGLVVTAAFILRMMRAVLMGEEKEEYRGLHDATRLDLATVVPLIVLLVLWGVVPGSLFAFFNTALQQFITHMAGV